MKERIKHYIKEILMFVIAMTVIANLISFYKSTELNNERLSIPTINLLNEDKYVPEDGKALLVHFWATWCPVCKLEASNIQTISENFNVLTIAVNSGEDKAIESYLAVNNLDFKVYNDNSALLASKYNIAVYPTTFIYNKDKKLVFSDVGYTSTWGLWLRMWWTSL